jgi:L-rhamnose mutarotase
MTAEPPAAGEIETIAFALRVRAGMEAEYLRRHDALWPEMRAALLGAGILHYEIWLHAPTRWLFAHQIRRRGGAPTPAGAAAMARWRAFMADVLEQEDGGPVRETLSRQFHLSAADIVPHDTATTRRNPT